jgi:iron(III) transport system permease protein
MSGARIALAWAALGLAGALLLPWYSGETGSALVHAWAGRWWLVPPAFALVLCLLLALPRNARPSAGLIALAAGVGLAAFFLQAFALRLGAQPGIGAGAVVVTLALLFCFTTAMAARGACRGDAFVAGALGLCCLAIALFTLWPLGAMLASAFQGEGEGSASRAFFARLFSERLWGLACLSGGARCGVAWNTLTLALATAAGCTLLGLAFALTVTRTGFPAKRALRMLTVLPIVTPPFVIGLGLILIFGRSGVVNQLLEWAFGIVPGRWIYGLPGVLLAQLFAFTPVAFLVLIGVAEGVSPAVEEAAQTLRADPARTFATVSLPLMGPGLANAFLLSFIESIADFGNPIVLGGNFAVLSTEIYFSLVGAQLDQARAATLAFVLLAFALGAFVVQRFLLRRKSYVSMTGKGGGGRNAPLPAGARRAAFAIALPWAALTLAIYAIALVGGFAETWGRDHSFTLKHFIKAFEVTRGTHGLVWSGAAWHSFGTTVMLALIAAPFTAALGLLTAWLITRQPFAGRSAFEFGTMLSFAVPGTEIGVAYVLAFNVPPVEITGTALVIVLCFVFRNMPVGVRAGVAAMSQLDPSLDEAARVLRSKSPRTLRLVLAPLLKPAIVAALTYGFVRAMTTVSAVVFLVSAEYDLATTYIIGRVVNGDYGVAIAYCAVLIVLMVVIVGAIQLAIGERRIGQPALAAAAPAAGIAA